MDVYLILLKSDTNGPLLDVSHGERMVNSGTESRQLNFFNLP